jgi:ribosomal protein L37AE/L43A
MTQYTAEELLAELERRDALGKEEKPAKKEKITQEKKPRTGKYKNDDSICPHCDSTGPIRDVGTGTKSLFWWCHRCSASWTSVGVPGGYHKYRSVIHETPCHAVIEV